MELLSLLCIASLRLGKGNADLSKIPDSPTIADYFHFIKISIWYLEKGGLAL
jgi:hypothetical protein